MFGVLLWMISKPAALEGLRSRAAGALLTINNQACGSSETHARPADGIRQGVR